MSTTAAMVKADRGESAPAPLAAHPSPTRGALIVADALVQETEQRKLLGQYVQHHMHEGTDYGVIPGTENKTLLKPGAEKLTQLFRCVPRFVIEEKVENWETGLFHYRFSCQVVTQADGTVVAEGVGSCSTYEGRYRWRNADRLCPQCGKAAIKRSKFPPKDNPAAKPGWYCFGKAGGCGANFDHDDPEIVGQKTGRVQNPDLIDCVNTVLKMAKKRALVDAAIALARCSDLFTQDVEDFPDPGHAGDPPAPSPVDVARERISAASSLEDLGAVWQSLPPGVQARLLADKDARKAQLTPPPATTTPAAEPATPGELGRLRLDVDAELSEAGRTLADFLGQHARKVGVDLSRGVPKLADLTAAQLTACWQLLAGSAVPQ